MEINKDIFYNIATQDISAGLKDFEISSSQDYFILLEAPTDANIRVKLNSVTAHEIPIKENWQFQSDRVGKIYLSCDAIEGKKIKYGQADGNLNIQPNPTINSIDTITNVENFNDNLLSQLDKIANPYEFIESESFTYSGTTQAQVLKKILSCDKIKVFLSAPSVPSAAVCRAILYLDDISYGATYSYAQGNSNTFNYTFEVENVRGKEIYISIGYNAYATVQYFNKKV